MSLFLYFYYILINVITCLALCLVGCFKEVDRIRAWRVRTENYLSIFAANSVGSLSPFHIAVLVSTYPIFLLFFYFNIMEVFCVQFFCKNENQITWRVFFVWLVGWLCFGFVFEIVYISECLHDILSRPFRYS